MPTVCFCSNFEASTIEHHTNEASRNVFQCCLVVCMLGK